MSIQRWEVREWPTEMVQDDAGGYVTYTDHVAEVQRLRENVTATMAANQAVAVERVRAETQLECRLTPDDIQVPIARAAEAMRAACLLAVERFHHADCVEPDVCDWCAQLTFVVAALREVQP